LADTVSVLRDGKLVAQQPANKLKAVDMAHLMVGRELGALYPPKVIRTNPEVALQVENLIVPPSLSSANFVLHKGEILGFAGLIGAGRTELFEGLLGLRPATGRVSVGNKFNSVFSSVAAAAKAGLAYVTEDRKGKGLLLNLELTPNLTLSTLQQFTNAGFIQHRLESAALDVAFSRYDIRAKSHDMDAGRLSGGNQQKLLLAKTLQADPSIIIIDEPTRGVDIGAKKQIYELIARLAESGKSIIVISSEMPELIGLCHRIVVMHRGQLVGTLEGSDINERKIVTLATGTEKQAA
ncbi:MAG TPA: ATP-binding cassette domain-containing protein, partial [Aestuariivirga sp.]